MRVGTGCLFFLVCWLISFVEIVVLLRTSRGHIGVRFTLRTRNAGVFLLMFRL